MGGCVAATVVLTTAGQRKRKTVSMVLASVASVGERERGRHLTCLLLHADPRSLQVGGLGVNGSVVKGFGAQALEAVAALRASDGDLLGSALGGYGGRDKDPVTTQRDVKGQGGARHSRSRGLALSL